MHHALDRTAVQHDYAYTNDMRERCGLEAMREEEGARQWDKNSLVIEREEDYPTSSPCDNRSLFGKRSHHVGHHSHQSAGTQDDMPAVSRTMSVPAMHHPTAAEFMYSGGLYRPSSKLSNSGSDSGPLRSTPLTGSSRMSIDPARPGSRCPSPDVPDSPISPHPSQPGMATREGTRPGTGTAGGLLSPPSFTRWAGPEGDTGPESLRSRRSHSLMDVPSPRSSSAGEMCREDLYTMALCTVITIL